jgi:hypothetical protein
MTQSAVLDKIETVACAIELLVHLIDEHDSVVWETESLNRRTYDLLANNIAASCLHAIACLYVPQK